jgi:hypothetical protein
MQYFRQRADTKIMELRSNFQSVKNLILRILHKIIQIRQTPIPEEPKLFIDDLAAVTFEDKLP